jgi:hypothetical protein
MMKNQNSAEAWDKKIHYFLVFMQIIFYLVATSNYCLQIKSTLKDDGSTITQPHKVFEL